MKYPLIALTFVFGFLFSSCKKEQKSLSSIPDCVQTIIDDMQENDVSPDCFATIKHYSYEGESIFEVQSDACLDGPITLMDADCNAICTFHVLFSSLPDCVADINFYEEATLIEVVWEEEN